MLGDLERAAIREEFMVLWIQHDDLHEGAAAVIDKMVDKAAERIDRHHHSCEALGWGDHCPHCVQP